MFGIGLPEFILIMALALIVVGPDKLPDLAKSVAKGILELKKTANTLKESLSEEGSPLADLKPELEEVAQSLKDQVLNNDEEGWSRAKSDKIYDGIEPVDNKSTIIDVDAEELSEEDNETNKESSADTETLSPEDQHLEKLRKTAQESE